MSEETSLTDSFAFQTAFAAYSVPNKTDRFYDLAGSLGFISTTLVSLVSLRHHACPRHD
jgi:hypothetical protein